MKAIDIHEHDANQRVDRFLKKFLPRASLGLIYKFLRKGKIKVNKKRTAFDRMLQEGDMIFFFFKYEELDLLKKEIKAESPSFSEKIEKKRILYEDNSVLIYNKPRGIIVHPGDFKTKDISLIQLIQDYLKKDKIQSLTFQPSLVHRIDKDTSGCIMVAKTKEALMKLTADFKERKVRKIYLALCEWIISEKEGSITDPLLRRELSDISKKTKKVIVHPDGKKAHTEFKVLEKKWEKTLCEVLLKTWRMHQIRVHMAHIGHPLVGDYLYGNGKKSEQHLLHARELTFQHPVKKKEMRIYTPIPSDMKI